MMMYGGSQWEPGGLSVSIIPEPKALTGAKNENRRPPVGIQVGLKQIPKKRLFGIRRCFTEIIENLVLI